MKSLYPIFFILSLWVFLPIMVEGQIITTIAGNGTGGYSGEGGLAINASIGPIINVIFDHAGNYYFVNRWENRVLKVDITTGIIHTVAGNGNAGFSGDSGLATAAQLNSPIGLAIDSIDNLYIADFYNNRVRKVNAITGIINTIAGNGSAAFSGDNGLATLASLYSPEFICLDKKGDLYINDINNYRIRKVNSAGIISTVVGTGIYGYNGDGGLADTTEINGVLGMCTDVIGNLYISDLNNYRIRMVDAITHLVSTVVGNGISGYNGDGITATSAEINPYALTFDLAGNMYVADWHARIRKVNIADGIITTVAGNGISGFSGDNGVADSAKIYDPNSVAFDTCGNLFIADEKNKRIRKVTFDTSCGHNTSINNIVVQSAVSFYPNPISNELNIIGIETGTRIVLFNILGQEIYKGLSTDDPQGGRFVIDTKGFANGIYILELTKSNSNGTSKDRVVRKVVKE